MQQIAVEGNGEVVHLIPLGKNDIVSVVILEAKSCKKGLFNIARGRRGNTQAINRLRTLSILKVRPEAIVRGNEVYVKAIARGNEGIREIIS